MPGDGPLYCEPQDVRNVLAVDGADPTGSTGASFDDTALTLMIQDAQAEVDSRLSVKYATPFPVSSVHPLVVQVTRDIAAYLATTTFYQGQELPPNAPVTLRFTRATSLLTLMVSGEIPLDLVEGVDDTPAATAAVINPYCGQLWGPNNFGLGPAIPWDLRGDGDYRESGWFPTRGPR